MVTGKFKCVLCNNLKNYNKQSKYFIETNKTNKVFNLIEEYVCLDCLNKLSYLKTKKWDSKKSYNVNVNINFVEV